MAPAYTKLIWSHRQGSSGLPATAPAVPAGFIWVLRDLTATNLGEHGVLQGCNNLLFTLNTIPMLSTPQLRSMAYVPYRWRDIRIVISPSDSWQANSTDVNWSWLATGYQLST